MSADKLLREIKKFRTALFWPDPTGEVLLVSLFPENGKRGREMPPERQTATQNHQQPGYSLTNLPPAQWEHQHTSHDFFDEATKNPNQTKTKRLILIC